MAERIIAQRSGESAEGSTRYIARRRRGGVAICGAGGLLTRLSEAGVEDQIFWRRDDHAVVIRYLSRELNSWMSAREPYW